MIILPQDEFFHEVDVVEIVDFEVSNIIVRGRRTGMMLIPIRQN